MNGYQSFSFEYLTSIDLITADAWNAICASDYPFLRHEFLAALEHSGSVGGKSGWQPYHLTVYQHGKLVA